MPRRRLGLARCTQRVGYIHFVAVRNDSRTLGLGRTLYETFEKAARERGAVALKAITNPENESEVVSLWSAGPPGGTG